MYLPILSYAYSGSNSLATPISCSNAGAYMETQVIFISSALIYEGQMLTTGCL